MGRIKKNILKTKSKKNKQTHSTFSYSFKGNTIIALLCDEVYKAYLFPFVRIKTNKFSYEK